MSILSIDIETYSSMDLTKCGVYAYTESEDFEILLLAYAFDDEEVKIIDFKCGESIPIKLREALTDKSIIKTAFNANFERTCLAKYLNEKMPPEQWRCTAVHALSLGLPQRLESVAKCLNLKHQKMNESKALIRYFSMPCKGTKVNGNRMRNLPKHDMNKWNLFKNYCMKDVEVEREIRKYLDVYPIINW
ncbi:hypothetical protein [Clostridium tarantellae]|uniref:Uncharacterized protein n=1 Tax=Clostridium tarantellae TaxID=39493 RepID=A0A6I1MQ40_9CLOT|nr:hypothetical protein [Clostridium tarantellae]MPQ44598.1 hypothetical protein [Clostridium tarantellae]